MLNEERGRGLRVMIPLFSSSFKIPHSKFKIDLSTLPLEGAIIEGRRTVWVSVRRPHFTTRHHDIHLFPSATCRRRRPIEHF
jgi:hypothetical protein